MRVGLGEASPIHASLVRLLIWIIKGSTRSRLRTGTFWAKLIPNHTMREKKTVFVFSKDRLTLVYNVHIASLRRIVKSKLRLMFRKSHKIQALRTFEPMPP